MASHDSRFQVRLYSPTVYTSYNKEIPLGQNDGALWQGRGRNWFMRTGVGVQYGPLTVVVRPEFVRTENREFPLERDLGTEHQNYRHPRFGGTRYQDFLMYADLPLFFGDEPVSSFHLAESFIQAEFKRLDRKSTRLNSSHVAISYAVFCLKYKNCDVASRGFYIYS